MTLPSHRLRTVFLGTPAFAVPSLAALNTVVDLVTVITQPDRPKGRGRPVTAPPVAVAARQLGLPLAQPARLKDSSFLVRLSALRPEVIVTVAYGKIIPDAILSLPPLGCINVHPSLLPKYRGASPIQAAIAAGEAETGVTIMYQTSDLDAGDIIAQRRIPIAADDTAATLEANLAQAGAELLVDVLLLMITGAAPRQPQDSRQATYVGKLTKEHGKIDWHRPAAELARLVRAMNPWPSAYTWHRDRRLKIWKARPVGGGPPTAPGVVLEVQHGAGFTVACGEGSLLVMEVQPEAGRHMTADEYARGSRLQVGERLGEPGSGKLGNQTP